MPIYAFMTSSYAMAVYLYGTRTFQTINVAYTDAVKQYAADTFAVSQIDYALARGYITQQEYEDTMALKAPIVPPVTPESEL